MVGRTFVSLANARGDDESAIDAVFQGSREGATPPAAEHAKSSVNTIPPEA